MLSPPTVCVITGTTGHPMLKRAIESVQEQTYAMIEHLVVIDGPERYEPADAILNSLAEQRGVKTIRLPYATGKNTWNGHRIYGAMNSIAMTDYVCWLDEDNWFEPDHIESLVESIRQTQAAWAFSLRKIVDQDGQFVCLDECESLGNLNPTFKDDNDFHIDTSCYLVRRDVAIQLSGVWNRPAWPVDGAMGPDRLLCRVLMEHFTTGRCTRKFSVNYTVGNSPKSVTAEFFIHGNQIMKAKHPNGLPWELP